MTPQQHHPEDHSLFHSQPQQSSPIHTNQIIGLVLTSGNGSFSESTCPQCQQRFNKKSHLYRHLREKHEQSRQYLCTAEGCGKSFKRGSHLKRHMISHTHEKKFKCLKCIMEFGYKHHLDRHIKIIHDKELFKCEECGAEHSKKKGLAKCKKQHDQAKIRMLKKKEKGSKQVEDPENDDAIKKTKRIKKQSKMGKSGSQQSRSNSDEEKEQIFESSVQSQGKLFENPESHQDRKQDENTNNPKMPISVSSEMQPLLNQEDPNNAETIFNLLGQTNKKDPKSCMMFRCAETGCLSAYSSKSGLKNHMKKVHENSACLF